jgi:hypothetical protein
MKHCHKVKTTHKPRKNKIYDSGMEKKSSKQNTLEQLIIKKNTHLKEMNILNI